MTRIRRPMGWMAAVCAGAAALCHVASAAAADEVMVRVFVADRIGDPNLLQLRDDLLRLGGQLKGHARGEVLLVKVNAAQVPAVTSLPGVRAVETIPAAAAAAPARLVQGAASVQTPSALKSCASPPSAAQSARIAAREQALTRPAANAFSQRRSLLSGAPGRPPAVDNSVSPHFPPIGDQEGRASCVAWAAGYYLSTYIQADRRGLNVAGVWLPREPNCVITGPDPQTLAQAMRCEGKADCPMTRHDPSVGHHVWDAASASACMATLPPTMLPPRPSAAHENIASPAFLYPLINDGVDEGAVLSTALESLGTWGVGSWQMKPYDPWHYDSVVADWPSEAQWVEALRRRTMQTVQLSLVSDAGFEALRQELANGRVVVAGATLWSNLHKVWAWRTSCQLDGTCPGIDNDVLFANQGGDPSRHAFTIVGYDDDRPYTVQPGDVRKGALLVANSAGPGFGVTNTAQGPQRGYFWVGYDYARAQFSEVGYAIDRPSYRPRAYAAVRLSGPSRAGLALAGHVWFPPVDKFASANVIPFVAARADRPINAAERFVVDMTDGLPVTDLARPLWAVRASGALGTTLVSTDFYFDRSGAGVFEPTPAADPTQAITPSRSQVVACTAVPRTIDIDGNGSVSRADVEAVLTGLRSRPVCLSDRRDVDGDGTITVLDARRVVLQCGLSACAP